MCVPSLEIVLNTATAAAAIVSVFFVAFSMRQSAKATELQVFMQAVARMEYLTDLFRREFADKEGDALRPWALMWAGSLETFALLVNEKKIQDRKYRKHFSQAVVGFREFAQRVIPAEISNDAWLEEWRKLERTMNAEG